MYYIRSTRISDISNTLSFNPLQKRLSTKGAEIKTGLQKSSRGPLVVLWMKNSSFADKLTIFNPFL